MHSDPGSGTVFDPTSGYVRLLDELDRHPDEPLVIKTSVNAFTTTNLQQQLVRRVSANSSSAASAPNSAARRQLVLRTISVSTSHS